MTEKNNSDNNNTFSREECLDQLLRFLQEYKLSQYYQVFVTEGFDRLLSLFDITESDLIALDVKRGHRRLLQRAIATARGIPLSTPIIINYQYEPPKMPFLPKPGTEVEQTKKRKVSSRKRKQFVPSKPVTAFDELINEIKAEFKELSTADILPIAYQRWNQLTSPEKEKYEREALHANSDYILDGMDLSHRYSSSDSDTDCSKRNIAPCRYMSRYQPLTQQEVPKKRARFDKEEPPS